METMEVFQLVYYKMGNENKDRVKKILKEVHLVKFLISFSAQVLTIFLGFPLQYPWRNLKSTADKQNCEVPKQKLLLQIRLEN